MLGHFLISGIRFWLQTLRGSTSHLCISTLPHFSLSPHNFLSFHTPSGCGCRNCSIRVIDSYVQLGPLIIFEIELYLPFYILLCGHLCCRFCNGVFNAMKILSKGEFYHISRHFAVDTHEDSIQLEMHACHLSFVQFWS